MQIDLQYFIDNDVVVENIYVMNVRMWIPLWLSWW